MTLDQIRRVIIAAEDLKNAIKATEWCRADRFQCYEQLEGIQKIIAEYQFALAVEEDNRIREMRTT